MLVEGFNLCYNTSFRIYSLVTAKTIFEHTCKCMTNTIDSEETPIWSLLDKSYYGTNMLAALLFDGCST